MYPKSAISQWPQQLFQLFTTLFKFMASPLLSYQMTSQSAKPFSEPCPQQRNSCLYIDTSSFPHYFQRKVFFLQSRGNSITCSLKSTSLRPCSAYFPSLLVSPTTYSHWLLPLSIWTNMPTPSLGLVLTPVSHTGLHCYLNNFLALLNSAALFNTDILWPLYSIVSSLSIFSSLLPLVLCSHYLLVHL